MELNPFYRMHLELKEKVERLSQAGNNGGSVDLSDIIVRLKALESRPSVDNEVNNLKSVISNLEASNKELQDKINYLSKIDNLEGRIYNLETETKYNEAPIMERFAALENNNYLERINTLTNRMNNTEQLTATLTDLSYRVVELEKKPDLSERVNGLELAVASINTN
jgi:predicted RNase H-like nuclease (RuvC/YqgF family)